MPDPIYNDRKWKRIARARRKAQPLCVLCLVKNKRTWAVHTHHLDPVKGSKHRLYTGKTINLCQPCHDYVTALERKGINPYQRGPRPRRTDDAGVPTEDFLTHRSVKRAQRREIELKREQSRSLQ